MRAPLTDGHIKLFTFAAFNILIHPMSFQLEQPAFGDGLSKLLSLVSFELPYLLPIIAPQLPLLAISSVSGEEEAAIPGDVDPLIAEASGQLTDLAVFDHDLVHDQSMLHWFRSISGEVIWPRASQIVR